MDFLALIGSFLKDDLLPNRGDELSLRRGKNDALIGKYHSGDGKVKFSKTEYKNGTVHETRTYKK